MKKAPIVILDFNFDFYSKLLFAKLAGHLVVAADLNYNAILLDDDITFEEWSVEINRDPCINQYPPFLGILSGLLDRSKIKYLSIGADVKVRSALMGINPRLFSKTLAGQAITKSDGAEVLTSPKGSLAEKCGERDNTVSENFNAAFSANIGCITLINPLHVKTIYKGFMERYPQYIKEIVFICLNRANSTRFHRLAEFSLGVDVDFKEINTDIISILKAEVPKENIIMVDSWMDDSLLSITLDHLGPRQLERDISLGRHSRVVTPPPPSCICSNPSSFRCSVCFTQVYCSPECQRRDWPMHKSSCTQASSGGNS